MSHGDTSAPAPIPGSYWLVERQLLAGQYPGVPDKEGTRCTLDSLVSAGIRTFIDLTETQDGLRPYDDVLRELARDGGLDLRYHRMAVPDFGIPAPELMTRILETIRSEVAAGRPVYFHCRGGIGRTGTVAGCWLVEQGHSCDDALARTRELRFGTADGLNRSPETDEQRSFVRSWRSRPEDPLR